MAQCICELRERDIPEPYTLNPQPQPKLQNLSTSPKTLNPKPRSLNPTPELNQNLDTGPKPRIVDPQVRGSGPLLRSLPLSLWHKKALSKDCFLQACSRKGSDLETTRDTTTAAVMFYDLEFILRDHFYISEPRERGPTHLPPDKGEPRMGLETEALLFESCKLCPEATDSGFQVLQQLFLRGLCLIKIVYKRSHFTKLARVSLTSLADRNNEWGDNSTLRRGEGS